MGSAVGKLVAGMLKSEDVLKGLTKPQREAATHIDGPLLVLAGAGSGKTRTITRRVAFMVSCGIPAQNILAITFTNKAAGEMRERIRALLGGAGAQGRGVNVLTFHALGARIVRDYADLLNLPASFTIFDTADQLKLIKQALSDCGLSPENYPPQAIRSAISGAKNKLQTPGLYTTGNTDHFARCVARVYSRYETLLGAAKGVDFDDLLLKVAILLRDNKEIRTQLQDRFQYLLIDEYQDTNHAQFIIAHMLAMDHKNICATGDPDQSIYGWRGANLNNILEFEQFFPNAKVVYLEQNYRSTKNILAAASALIANNIKRKKKDLWTENEQGPLIDIITCRDEAQEAEQIVERVQQAHDQQKIFWGDMAVFYRVNSLSRALEDAFMKAGIPYQVARGTEFYGRKEIRDVIAYMKVVVNVADNVSLERIANVPPRAMTEANLDFIRQAAEQRGVSMLQAMQQLDTTPIPSLTRQGGSGAANLGRIFLALRQWVYGTTPPPAEVTEEPSEADLFQNINVDELMESSEEYNPGVHDEIATETAPAKPRLTMKAILERIYTESGLEAMHTKQRQRDGETDDDPLANVNELINVAAEFDAQNTDGTLDDFLAQITLASDVDRLQDAGGAVTLMTLHAAKGLEFPWVGIVGWEDGLLPHMRALMNGGNETELEEERRLAFVGITRAMKHLLLTNARCRMIRGETQRTIASQFLRELPKETFNHLDLAGEEPLGSRGGSGRSESFRSGWQQRFGGASSGPSSSSGSSSSSSDSSENSGHRFRRGMMVRHAQFGIGRIEHLEKAGNQTRTVVTFNTHGRKTLILEYAHLEPLGS